MTSDAVMVTHLVYDQAVDGQLGYLRNPPRLCEEPELLQLVHHPPALPLQARAGIILQQTR